MNEGGVRIRRIKAEEMSQKSKDTISYLFLSFLLVHFLQIINLGNANETMKGKEKGKEMDDGGISHIFILEIGKPPSLSLQVLTLKERKPANKTKTNPPKQQCENQEDRCVAPSRAAALPHWPLPGPVLRSETWHMGLYLFRGYLFWDGLKGNQRCPTILGPPV